MSIEYSKISIVVASYNGGKYIYQQLQSLNEQTLKADEVLIFDDCSTKKDTVETIKRFIADENLSWLLYENPNNLGWRRNFIQAIEKTHGEFIFLSDQDDVWNTDKLRIMAELMAQRKEINLLCCNYSILNETNKRIRTNSTQYIQNDGSFERIMLNEKFHLVGRPGCTYCLRKSFAKKAITAWCEGYAHDKLLWNAAMLSGGLYRINLPLVTFRRHENNASSQGTVKRRERRLEKHIIDMEVYNNLKLLFKDEIETMPQKQKLILKAYERWLSIRMSFLQEKNLKDAVFLLKYTRFYSSALSLMADFISN